jgi:octopine/nopaline transport system permease protein
VIDFPFMIEALTRIAPGIPLTLNLMSISVAAGFVLAVLLAAMRMSRILPLDWFARAYVFAFRGTPLLVQMFLIYYGLPQFRGLRDTWLWPFLREPYWCAVLALTLNTAAYASEIVRGGLLAVPFGQVEAARAGGLSGLRLFRRIVAPIALRQALPAYTNEVILMIKATSLASLVSLAEVTGLAYQLRDESYRAVEVFVVAGSIYLLLTFILTRAVQALEWWLSPHLRGAPPVGTPLAGAELEQIH